MKTLTTTLTVLIVGMVLTVPLLADDVDDVKAAVMDLCAAVTRGDAAAVVRHMMPTHTEFGRGGGLLVTAITMEEQRRQRQTLFENVKLTLVPRHVEVKVYGNTAVATYYLNGTVVSPNGDTNNWTDRRTGVWVKQGGNWREVHWHQSPLQIP